MRKLVAVEEHEMDTLKSAGAQPHENVEDPPLASDNMHGSEGEPIEPELALENEGKFPTLTDQGEGQAAPHRRGKRCGQPSQ